LRGRRKQKNEESKGRRNMKIGSGIVNVIDMGSGDVNVNVNVKGLVSGVAEGVGKEGGGLTGDRTNTEMGETRKGTGSVTGMETPHVTGLVGEAGLALLLGMATGHQEALFDHIK